jgi:hypothetical protein
MNAFEINRSVWLTRFLGIAAVLETGVALVLLVDPAAVALILLQAKLEAAGEIIGRIAGGGLLSLGIACWCARNTPTAPAGIGVGWALLAYNFAACITLAWAGTTITGTGFLIWVATALHGLFGTALLVTLLRRHD